VLVELWATWCPPCRSTLSWLGKLRQRHGERIEVVALAIESDESDVRKLATELALPVRFAMGSPEIARSFGDLSAVPTLFLFDARGRMREAFFGAPPDLEEKTRRALDAVLGDGPGSRTEEKPPTAPRANARGR
jgi:thiol-disulfide isomerase/thioredoxin